MFDCRLLTRFQRVVSAGLVALALPLANCSAEDLPLLGIPEPIGSLAFNESPLELEPELGAPILLAALEVASEAESVSLPDPDEIALHLKLSSQLLKSAGLAQKAEAIDSVLNDFEAEHRGRLVLRKKRAELARLQSEIEQLSRRFESPTDNDVELMPVDYQIPSPVLEE
jgi:hypothetical protein